LSLRRILALLSGDAARGLRSPVVRWMIIMPFAVTFLIKVVLTTLLLPEPRLALLSSDPSEVASILRQTDGIRVTQVGSRHDLLERVEHNNADVGLYLGTGFDDSLQAGERPVLEMHFSEKSPVLSRTVLALLILGAVRDVSGEVPPLQVTIEGAQEEDIPITEKLIPAVVLLVMMISGIFVPAFLLVEEKETGTIRAVLVSPVTMNEMLVAKAILGFLMTVVICTVTLALNGALRGNIPALMAIVIVGTAMSCTTGLVYGILSGNAKTLYTLVKSLNILLAGPMILFMVQGVPRWIGKLFPTYWFIDPLYRTTLGLSGAVYGKLAIALLISALLWIPLLMLGKRMQRKLAEK